MSLTRVHRNAVQLLQYVASRTGLTEAVRKLQLARQFAASDDELKQLHLKWIPGILQEWLQKKAIQVFGERTWKYQDSLPPLPVPALKNTLDKYLESVKPFVTAEEYKHTETVVREFEEGVGQSLHQQLLERAKVKRNRLEDWWVDLTYLQSRHSLPLTSNVVGFVPVMDHMWSAIGVEPADRVPLFLSASLYLWKLLRKEQIPIDKAVLTGQPFCMNQFRSMFSAHRIPGVTMDKLVSHFKTESEGPSPTHITVLCKGRVFKMEVIDQDGEPLTPAELKIQLEGVKQQCENVCEGPHISVLTAGNRTQWAKALHQTLAGSGKNRWFDHVNTEVAFKNGLFAGNFEHTPADGMVAAYLGYFVFAQSQRIGPIRKDQVSDRSVPEPEELIFAIDDEIRDEIIHTQETFIKQASDLELVCPSFTDYGKKFIRSFKLHPDYYMQTALQLAYFRLHRKPAPTHQPATLRQYYHGRTETVRSCTMEVVNWCKAMMDNTVPIKGKKELMMAALKKHIQLMEEAKNMLGCDRHLLGLRAISQNAGIPLPSLFRDTAYTKSLGGGYVMLNTLIGYTPAQGAVAPKVPHGYCIAYSIQPDRLTYSVSAWKSCKETSAEEMSASIQQSLRDMHQLLMTS